MRKALFVRVLVGSCVGAMSRVVFMKVKVVPACGGVLLLVAIGFKRCLLIMFVVIPSQGPGLNTVVWKKLSSSCLYLAHWLVLCASGL